MKNAKNNEIYLSGRTPGGKTVEAAWLKVSDITGTWSEGQILEFYPFQKSMVLGNGARLGCAHSTVCVLTHGPGAIRLFRYSLAIS